MKTLMSFALLLFLASACSEKEIAPVDGDAKIGVEDEQPPKSNCGRPDCV